MIHFFLFFTRQTNISVTNYLHTSQLRYRYQSTQFETRQPYISETKPYETRQPYISESRPPPVVHNCNLNYCWSHQLSYLTIRKFSATVPKNVASNFARHPPAASRKNVLQAKRHFFYWSLTHYHCTYLITLNSDDRRIYSLINELEYNLHAAWMNLNVILMQLELA